MVRRPRPKPTGPLSGAVRLGDRLWRLAGGTMIRLNPDQRRAFELLRGPQRHTCLVGGSRSGKTTLIVLSTLVRAVRAPRSRHGIFRAHANAAKSSISLDTLPKVARLRFPSLVLDQNKSDGYFVLPNESEIWVGGLDDEKRVDKILGREYATLFFNECSQILYSTVLTALTRLAQVAEAPDGAKLAQRAYYDLNPVGRGHWTNVLFGDARDPFKHQPLDDPNNYKRAFLNPEGNAQNLTPEYIRSLQGLPERQRKRFYEGVYVDEYEGALWTYEGLERGRVEVESDNPSVEEIDEAFPVDKRRRVVVAVDPSGAASADDETRDEIGIVVAALGQDGHAYVLADRSLRDSPPAWARAALKAYHDFGADSIVAEENFGGAMVKAVIQAADPMVSVKMVRASRGKAVRAEPVSTLYGEAPDYKNIRVHHVGRLPRLEDQMVAFTSAGYRGEGSPDRADSLVWSVSELMLGSSAEAWISYFGKMADDARSEGAAEKPLRPVPEKVEAPQSSVADAYNRVARAVTKDKDILCSWCGEKLVNEGRPGMSQVVRGDDRYHEDCFPAASRVVAPKRADA